MVGKRIRTSPILLDFQGVPGFVLIITYGHSCASILNALNYNMKDIQTWLGHSDYKFTANTYVETEEDSHTAMAQGYGEKLADLLAG